MVFIETPLFTKLIRALLGDDDYKLLQQTILMRPEVGAVIQGSSGLRKMRWRMPGSGKRGSSRIIYYSDTSEEIIYMLLPYQMNKQENLTPGQLKLLRGLVEEGLK